MVQGLLRHLPESACNAGHPSLIPGSGRFPGEGNDNPLQYSCLENSTDRGAWWAIQSMESQRVRWSEGDVGLIPGQQAKTHMPHSQKKTKQKKPQNLKKEAIL